MGAFFVLTEITLSHALSPVKSFIAIKKILDDNFYTCLICRLGLLLSEKGERLMSNENQGTTQKPKRKRSPAYPGINLEVALDLVRQLKEHQGEHPTHPHVVMQVWGYKAHTGPGAVALAALSYFGLIDDEGTGEDRQVKISQLALEILWDDREESSERDEAIKKAALSPKIHRKLWDHFQGNLPPTDAGLRWYLLKEEKFSEGGADDFIRQFRHTISFAKLQPTDKILQSEDDKEPSEEKQPMIATSPPKPATSPSSNVEEVLAGSEGIREMPLYLSDKEMITIRASYPLSPEAWNNFLALLNILKAGLVKEKTSAKKDESDQ
jgi:hypothetical protein